jgi:stearoyl-CoA desaturase (delta-9 desaturase)
MPLRFVHSLGPILILLAHLGCLLVVLKGMGLQAVCWAVALYLVRMLSITAIYHRLITHRSYDAPRAVWWVGSLLASSSAQMGPSWWKAHHLQHHRQVDTESDPHSPLTAASSWRGFLHAQLGWLLGPGFHPRRLPHDIESDPILRLIDRLHWLPPLVLAWLSWALGGAEWLGAFCLSTTVLFHGVASVNSVAHLIGERPFQTADASRNNRWVALLTLGEGWHNFHHGFQGSARQGFTVRAGAVQLLPDPTYGFIRLLEALGLASRLRIPGEQAMLARAGGDVR